MTTSQHRNRQAFLRTGAAPLGLALALIAAPAFAQETPPAPAPSATAPASADEATGTDIVVTGTLFRNVSNANIASPITTVTADDLEKRGVNTVQQAIQMLASNNGPALSNSFTANGAFAGGASAVSLRGLTTNSTLVLFDGLRAAYYPLADDGSRNFVDLNTIPDEIVDRIEVLRDGASSSYGADAIAGVVNIITKRQITGITATGEAGISQRGDAANQRVSLTAGFGDLSTQRFNVYISGHYLKQDSLYSRDRGYPYNSANQTALCYQGTCGADARENSPINYAGVSTIVPVFFVRPANAANVAVPGSRYQVLNATAGCGRFPSYNPTPTQLGIGDGLTPNSSPTTVCTQDVVNDGGVIEPRLVRLGGSARASVDIGDSTHAYAEFNFEQSTVSYTGYGLAGPGVPTNSVIRANGPAGILYPRFSTSGVAGGANAPGSAPLALPVYICPRTTVGNCTAANGTLNPNNPYAASGLQALVIGTTPDLSQYSESRSRAYRLAAGVNGSFGNGWDWDISGVGMVNDLRRHYEGYVYIQHLLDVVKDGSYNFVNPSLNSQATRDYLAPTLNVNSNSQEYQVNASITHSFFDLPGGPLQVGVGGSARYESIYAPSANDDYNGPTQRYFVINAFGTVGKRWVESGFFEVKAPILHQLQLEGSGRYDHYSSGQSHFSPKGGVVFTPIKQLTLRGTISGGFRIPSFAESSALPTTGYVPYFTSLPNSYLAQYSNPGVTCNNKTPANCSTYVTTYAVGEQSTANPNLRPETSRNITVGGEFKPLHGLTFTADYYNIQKKNAITTTPFSAALTAYYSGQPVPAGYTIIINSPDVNHLAATPTISSVGAPFINANTIETEGVDFGANLRLPLGGGLVLSSSAEAEYIIKLNTTFADGHVEHYAGTLGNFNLTAGTGTPKWRGTWQNTLEFDKVGSISATAYYVDGYNLSAEDQGNVAGDCGLDGGLQACNVKSFIDVDMTGTVNVNDRFTFYVNVLNIFDVKPPLDTATYGGYLYNPVQAEQGIIGRAFRAGFKAKF